MSTGTEILPDLMLLAWPHGIPAEEHAIATGLTDQQRAVAEKRLRALLSYEDKDAGGNWARRSRDAELDRASFFEVLRMWREHRSLASIMPRVRPHGSGSRRYETIERLVADALEQNPDAPRRRIAEIVSERSPEPPALSTIEAVVDRERACRERKDLGGGDGFGRHVLVDTCPATMRIPAREKPLIAWTGFVIDVATDTVVASAAAENPFAAFSAACLRAADRIEELKTGGVLEPGFEVHLRGDAMSLLRETARLHDLGIGVRRASGRRSEASRASALLGRRFGPVTLKLRLDVPIEAERTVADDLTAAEMIDARVDGEADRQWKKWLRTRKLPAVDPTAIASVLRKLPPVGYALERTRAEGPVYEPSRDDRIGR